jgi:hypothetical protein
MITKHIPKKKQIVPLNRSLLRKSRKHKCTKKKQKFRNKRESQKEKDYRENKVKVRLKPIEKHNPTRNKAFPIAIKLRKGEGKTIRIKTRTHEASRNKRIPKNMKPNPRQISPTPIF